VAQRLVPSVEFWWNYGEVYIAPGVLVTDGLQLSQRRKRILSIELAGLIKRSLN